MQNQTGANFAQNNGISSPADYPNQAVGYRDIFYQLEQAIGADAQKVKFLVQKGVLDNQQGQYLMAQLARKAQEINNYKNSLAQGTPQHFATNPTPMTVQCPTCKNSMELFNMERPGFFEAEGRADVLNYIQGYDMDKDEILQISKLVEGLENSAVNKYLKQSDYERSLNDENAAAKSRLTAYAQNATPNSKYNRIFTREDIGAMSGEEFTRNEKLIMDQLKQGLIK